MQIKTLLNRVQTFTSCVYGAVRWVEDAAVPALEGDLHLPDGRPICAGCDRPRPGYDTLAVRRCECVPLWGMTVFFSVCAAARGLSTVWG
jgi:hypothetical protein